MEIKTQVEILNEIANKLGDTSPDEMITESQALQNILDHMDGGSGGDSSDMFFVVEIHYSEDDSIECEYKSFSDLMTAINENAVKIKVIKLTYSNGDVPVYRLAELIGQGLYYKNVTYPYSNDEPIYLSLIGYVFPFNPADPITVDGLGYQWSVTTFDPFD